MNAFFIYSLITILTTSYFFLNLWEKENQIYIFMIYLAKSKFYFSLLINFGLMVLVFVGKIVIKIFFGEIRLSEMIQVIEKIRMKFITFLLLFLTFRPTIDLSKIVLVVIYHCISILNLLTFKRSAYIVSSEERSKKAHVKIALIYIIVGCVDYILYTVINYPIDSKEFNSFSQKGTANLDSLIYYIFACEFIFLLIKLVSKFIKLIIDLTQINMQKHWNLKLVVFNVISFVRYAIKLAIEIKFCIVLVRVGVVPVFFIIDVFYSCWNLIKLAYKFYENYKTNKHINSLNDYVAEDTEDKQNMIICNICLDEIKIGKMLNCGHVFHLRCIKEWVTTNAGCPLCKEPISHEGKAHKRFYQNVNPNANDLEDDNSVDEFQALPHGESKTSNKDINLNNAKLLLPKQYPELKKYKTYCNILKTMNWIENSIEGEVHAETGAITYALPCQAVYSRNIHNEIKRLEIEIYNKKLLEMYDNPSQAMTQYEDDLKLFKNKIN